MAFNVYYADGFKRYSSYSDVYSYPHIIEASAFNVLSSGGRNNGAYIAAYIPNLSGYVQGWLDSRNLTYILGMAYRTPEYSLPSAKPVLGFGSAAATAYRPFIFENSDGTLSYYFNNTQVQKGSTVLSRSTWHYLELKVYFHDTAGHYEVRINEQTEMSGTGVSTIYGIDGGADSWSVNLFYPSAGGDAPLATDLCILAAPTDEAGGFVGDVNVLEFRPTGDGYYDSDWAPSTGVYLYSCVDDFAPISSSDYVSASGSGSKVSFTFDEISDSRDILAAGLVMLNEIFPAKTSRGVRRFCRSGGVDYSSTPELTGDKTLIFGLFDQNPATGLDWTAADLADFEFGLEIL